MTDLSAEVPQEWKSIGFSGLFSIESILGSGAHPMSPAEIDAFEARLPDRVPFGTNSGWLALRVNREAVPPTVVLIRRDADATVEALVRRDDGDVWHPW